MSHTYTKHCSFCSKPFQSLGGRYCSGECRKAGRPSDPKKGKTGFPGKPRNRLTKPCVVCGKVFEAKRSEAERRLYCGYVCYRLARWGSTRKGPIPCIVCGKEFISAPSR